MLVALHGPQDAHGSAGGVVSDLRGEPWSLGTDNLCASNGHLHGELLAVLRMARES